MDRYADIFQVGARNMQNFSLLRELGRARKPVLLKRGISATIEEWLLSAEYVLDGGNMDVILCERGIRTFETYTRNTLDISAIPIVKKLSHLPIFVDPSHGTGRRDKVAPMARAAVAAGADGLIIEVHVDPDHALSDGAQSMFPSQFDRLMAELRIIAPAIGRSICVEPVARRGWGVHDRRRDALPVVDGDRSLRRRPGSTASPSSASGSSAARSRRPRQVWPAALVIGVDTNDVIETAMRMHAVDVGADDLVVAAEADLVVLAGGADENARAMPYLAEAIAGDAVVLALGDASGRRSQRARAAGPPAARRGTSGRRAARARHPRVQRRPLSRAALDGDVDHRACRSRRAHPRPGACRRGRPVRRIISACKKSSAAPGRRSRSSPTARRSWSAGSVSAASRRT